MHVINTQITTEEKLRLLKACEKRGCTVYTFVKDAVLKAVESELSGRKGTEPEGLTKDDRRLEGTAKRIRTKVGDFVEFGGKLYKVE